MSLKNRSEVSTISSPEFINLQPLDINPLMSQCQIKVFYLGKNRNGSYITREVADEMAKTLRGAPIVAAWYDNKQDYGDHGHVMTIENGEVSFSCKTVPYGFVSPDAEVWYQQYIDYDEFNNAIERTYLCTTGYLWQGQFPEIDKVINEGQPQSMELDENSMHGHWAEDSNSGVEFFIIDDATFSKLCILGDDVEPCFEGSSVEETQFSMDKEFTRTLYSMMNELKFALKDKGGSSMPIDEELEPTEVVEEEVEEVASDNEHEVEIEETAVEAEESADAADDATDDEESEEDSEDGDSEDTDFACGDKDKKKYADEEDEDKEEDEAEEEVEKDEEDKKKSKPEPKPDHSLAEAFAALKDEFEAVKAEKIALENELNSLRDFKLRCENEKKDALINQYHMLDEADKADVIEHKNEYSYEQIEEKLALIYVKKNVNFNTLDGVEAEVEASIEDPALAFSLDNETGSFVPPIVELLRQQKNK
jgi:hypothetical protein